MRIDCHTHFLPAPFRGHLREADGEVRIERRGDQDFVCHTTGSFPLFPGFRDSEVRLEWMDDHDIDTTLASVSTPNPNEGPISVDESRTLVRAINDGFADLQDEYPGRIAGLGTLPLREPDESVAELDRIADLGLAGVALPTTVRGKKLSHPDLEPVFDRLDELDLTAVMHPGRNEVSHTFEDDEWIFNPLAVFPTETTIQVARLIFDGFFDRHDFDLVVYHMGGALPYLVGRLERGRDQFRSDPNQHPERPVVEYLQEFYYDTISFHPPAMNLAMETVGAEHLLFGTDYPFGMEKADQTLDDLEGLDLAGKRAGVMGETANELFDI
ncbi:amidohydrolase family protein [Saliphagus sp. GCM10025317]